MSRGLANPSRKLYSNLPGWILDGTSEKGLPEYLEALESVLGCGAGFESATLCIMSPI